MLIVTGINELNKERKKISDDIKIGFVSTMGALHLGHESLIQKAVIETDFVIVSIFVNPLPFAENEDLDKYPQQLDKDKAICEKLGAKLLFAPSSMEMNTISRETTMVTPPESMTSVLCGKYRPEHFVGVATIVTKLLNLVRPDIAFFWRKGCPTNRYYQKDSARFTNTCNN